MIVPYARRSAHRRGIASLIEVLVASSLTMVLLGATATLTITLYRLERLGREELGSTITEARFAWDFRNDVRSALGIVPESRPELLALELSDGSVSYQFEREEVLRRRKQASEPARIERYRLPRRVIAHWDFDESNDLVSVRLDQDSSTPLGRTTPPTHIDAKIGRDHRYLRGPE